MGAIIIAVYAEEFRFIVKLYCTFGKNSDGQHANTTTFLLLITFTNSHSVFFTNSRT